MGSWIDEELRYAELGDPRRVQRLKLLVSALAASPAASVPQACRTWSSIKGAYRFWANSHMTAEQILQAHYRATAARCAQQSCVLAIEDTSELDLTTHRAVRGLGGLDASSCRGIKLHSTLATSLDGVPLGLLDQQCWVRTPSCDATAPAAQSRPIQQKESFRWLRAVTALEARTVAQQRVIVVADREADLFELMAMARRPGIDLLLRAHYDRRVQNTLQTVSPAAASQTLRQAVEANPVLGLKSITLARSGERPERTVTLSVQAVAVTVLPPKHLTKHLTKHLGGHTAALPMSVVLAREVLTPESAASRSAASHGAQPIEWLLLTSLPVATAEEAFACVQYYSYRWLIERFHYVLKSGCRLEELHLQSAERFTRALATYGYVAWRELWLTYQARRHPLQSCECALEPAEWQALYLTIHRSNEFPEQAPTLEQAVRWIAQLGGFIGRTGDGAPGVKTIWRGLQRLSDIAEAWRLFTSVPRPQSSG